MAGVERGEFDDTVHEVSDVAKKIKKEGQVISSWIFLDNQSTLDVLHNNELLQSSQPGKGYMYIYCNARVTSTNMIGDLTGYSEVWYHPNGIKNIMLLKQVKNCGHHMT